MSANLSTNATTAERRSTRRKPWPAVLGYALATLGVVIAWQLREYRLIIAGEGLGYGLGIAGASMMLLLLLYPLRKRTRLLRTAGPIRHWFRAHMMLGVAGPILVLLHSNFSLGSINSQVALFCTIVVASSGLLGRYFYAGIHNGLYGQRTSFDAVRTEIESARAGDSVLGSIKPIINERLQPLEDAVSATPPGLRQSVLLAIGTGFKVLRLRRSLRVALRKEIVSLSAQSAVVSSNRKRLLVSTFRYLNYRLSVLLKFAQLHACERLLSLWHVVHYPLFMVLIVAAIVHVIAVHMY